MQRWPRKKTPKGIWLVIAGIVLFALRYIPSVKSEIAIGKQWYTLNEAYQLCGTVIGHFSDRCSWVEPLNIIVITIAILLVVGGAYLLYKERS